MEYNKKNLPPQKSNILRMDDYRRRTEDAGRKQDEDAQAPFQWKENSNADDPRPELKSGDRKRPA